MRQRWAAVPGILAAMALSLAACVTSQVRLPFAPVPAGPAIALQATPVALNPTEPGVVDLGGFKFAGGISVTSDQTSRLHGLSDLVVRTDGSILVVSDDGDLFKARLVLDGAGRPTGLRDGALHPLSGQIEEPLQGKDWGDAEGVTRLASGDMLVSFERRHRIWRYPDADGRRPSPAPMPDVAMALNEGMEGLAAAPKLGPDTYWVGVEAGGIWICHLKRACDPVAGLPAPPMGFRLSGLTSGPDGELVVLHHAYSPASGSRVRLEIVRDPMGAKTVIGSLALAPPLTIDNFEAVSVVPMPNGRWRLYLLSDDNFSPTQRTLLLAFDWTPPK